MQRINDSPIISFFAETLNGLPIIRSYKKEEFFKKKQMANLDNANKYYIARFAVTGWFSQMITYVSTLLIMTCSSFLIFGDFSPAFAGLLSTLLFSCERNLKQLI